MGLVEPTAIDKRTVVKTTVIFVAGMVLFATAVRALVAQEISATGVPPTLTAVVMLLLANRYVHRGGSDVVGAWWVMGVVMTIYAYLSFSSHGFFGSIIYTAPVFPLLAWIMLNRAATRLITLTIGFFIGLVLSQHLAGKLQSPEDFPEEIRHIMKSVVLILSLIAVYWMIAFKSGEAQVGAASPGEEESRDLVTGLLTRTAIDEVLRRELVRTYRALQPLSLVVADVDGFFQLKNEIGDVAADQTLLGIAEALRFSVRRSSDYLGRYDRSRFVVLLPDTDGEGADRVAQKFHSLMETLDIPYQDKDTIRVAVTVAPSPPAVSTWVVLMPCTRRSTRYSRKAWRPVAIGWLPKRWTEVADVFPLPPTIRALVSDGRQFPVHRIYCVGRNYAAHVAEMGGDAERDPPLFFSKPADALVGNDADIPYPPRTENFHHEVELVVALGQGGVNIAVADAHDYVFGYAVGNDLTRRDLQGLAKRDGQPWDVAKGFDNSAPISAITPAAEAGLVSDTGIYLKVNGELRQQGTLSQLIWSVAEVIAELSTLFALQPGDLIFTGTPVGVGPLQRGDDVEAGIGGAGNPASPHCLVLE